MLVNWSFLIFHLNVGFLVHTVFFVVIMEECVDDGRGATPSG